MQKLQKSKKMGIERLPSEWNLLSIEDITEFVTYGLTVRPKYIDEGIPLISAKEIRTGEIDFKNAAKISTNDYNSLSRKEKGLKDDVFFSKTGTIGLVARAKVNHEFAITQNIASLRPKKNIVLPEFIEIFLRTEFFLKAAYRTINTTTIPDLQLGEIKKIKIPIPDLKEQQKIASILSKVDALIQKTDQIIEQTQRLKKGLMQRLLTKGIGHSKFKKIKFHSINLDIPENWKYTKMKILSVLSEDAILTGPFGSMLHSYDYVKEGTPLILIKNIQNGRIVNNDIPKIAQKDVERLARYRLRKGDIVFSRVGRVGSAALIEEKHDGWLISGQTLRIRFSNPDVNSQFINIFIELDIFQKILKAGMLGSTRDSINTTILENSPVLLPAIEEQDRIVNRILNIDNSIEKNKKIFFHLQRLKKGLMQQLLTGKIRVKI